VSEWTPPINVFHIVQRLPCVYRTTFCQRRDFTDCMLGPPAGLTSHILGHGDDQIGEKSSCVYKKREMKVQTSWRLASVAYFPRLSTHWALLADVLLRFAPTHDALHVETVVARAPQRGAVVAGVLDARAARFKRHAANTAYFLVHLPLPHSNAVPAIHLYLHDNALGKSRSRRPLLLTGLAARL